MTTIELPTIEKPETTPPVAADGCDNRLRVTGVDGVQHDISDWTYGELLGFQCEQEPLFARAIEETEKGSDARCEITQLAYTTICTVLEQMTARFPAEAALSQEGTFSMGMDPRYSDLILRLLAQQQSAGVEGGLFEVGFSAGVLLQQVAAAGYSVGGLEVVEELRQQAKAKLDPKHHSQLLVGDFCKLDLSEHVGRYSVVYWNDVFEHVPTDEIVDYVKVIHSLLAPGGKLVTITPNWHMRPSDVTDVFKPPRSEAVGFHLKEYTAREVCSVVREAGFSAVETPTFISRKRIYLSGIPGLTGLKNALEPLLEWLPYRVAVQCCRRFGLNCTVATK
ncbi:MAG: hypothetical protein Aurels2KO_10830 [Aureliella sp.]